jgi:hypothetical protein
MLASKALALWLPSHDLAIRFEVGEYQGLQTAIFLVTFVCVVFGLLCTPSAWMAEERKTALRRRVVAFRLYFTVQNLHVLEIPHVLCPD